MSSDPVKADAVVIATRTTAPRAVVIPMTQLNSEKAAAYPVSTPVTDTNTTTVVTVVDTPKQSFQVSS